MENRPKAVIEGYEAYNRGVVVGDNPYNEKDPRYWQWMNGWADAGLSKKTTTED